MDKNKPEKAILKTLLYSDIFDFPLTKEELWKYLISEEKADKAEFDEFLQKLVLPGSSNQITQKDGYYCIKGREAVIKKRKLNIQEVHKKLRIAKTAAYFLAFIPTVFFIGLSGSTAIGNVDKTDDIDFFIITKKNTLYTTRLWVLAVLEMMNLRRKRLETFPTNKICVNLLIEEDKLSWPRHKHDLFIAHEIIQMKPLFDRSDIYIQFLRSNKWVVKYFPNVQNGLPETLPIKKSTNYFTIRMISYFTNLFPTAFLIRFFQKVHMQKNQSTEFISDHILAFHPFDYRKETLLLYREKIKSFFPAY